MADPAALGRRLAEVEEMGDAARRLYAETAGAKWELSVAVVAGPPGAGKSTLLAAAAAEAGPEDAFLLVDPSSVPTGGAVLADRARFAGREGGGPFVRSLATRGHTGGAAGTLWPMLRCLATEGFRRAIVESAGVGQSAPSLRGVADLLVLVVSPESGDAQQAVKAGLLEEADLVVVNKADRPGARALAASLGAMTGRSPLVVSARTGEGVPNLVAALADIPDRDDSARRRAEARDLATARFLARLEDAIGAWDPTSDPWEFRP